MAWLTNWNYRRPVTISNTGSALTDYQILVTIDTSSIITAGKMLSNGNDIRFTSSDGSTLLSYWIESGINTTSTKIWVKIPSILSGTNTIYLYYGNPSAASASSGTNTFDLFDDFADGNYTTNPVWIPEQGTWTVVNQELKENGFLSYRESIYTSISQQNFYYQITFKNPPKAGRGQHYVSIIVLNNNPMLTASGYQLIAYWDAATWADSQNWMALVRIDSGVGAYLKGPATTPYTRDSNYHTMGISIYNGTIKCYFDGVEKISTVDSTYSTFSRLYIYTADDASPTPDGVYDNIISRKYASPEPTFSSLGTEEQQQLGNLDISSTPSGANIYIDNILQTGVTTPAIITGLLPGSHTYKLTKSGYADTIDTFTIISGMTTTIAVTLSSFLSGWTYRKFVLISNTGFKLSDYQVLVPIDTSSLISLGHMLSNCDDIRFTDADGSTLLPYWIESGINTTSTKIWVKIPSIPVDDPTYGMKRIYMYYGNPSAAPASNGTDTFDFFDDFESGTLSKWTSFGTAQTRSFDNTISISGNSLKLEYNGSGNSGIQSIGQLPISSGKVLEFWWRANTQPIDSINAITLFTPNGGTVYGSGDSAGFIKDLYESAMFAGNAISPGYVYGTHATSYVVDKWYKIRIYEYGTTIRITYIDSDGSTILGNESAREIYIRSSGYTTIQQTGPSPNILWIDNIFVRKYMPIEPTSYSVSTEEISSDTGNLSISSTPPNASIYIDDLLRTGTITPYTITGLSPSPPSHKYTLTLAGYEDKTGTFSISSGLTTTVTEILTALPLLSSWASNKPIIINGAIPGAQTDGQIKFTIYKGSGTDTAFHKYLGINVRDDFGDVRFTASDGSTLLSYWIESFISGSQAVIWVKVPSISASPTQTTIYVYYDNPTATTTSNENNTFVFFDHFLGTSLDLNKWHGSIDTAAVSSSVLTVGYNSPYSEVIKSIETFSLGYVVESRANIATPPTNSQLIGFGNGAPDFVLAWWNNASGFSPFEGSLFITSCLGTTSCRNISETFTLGSFQLQTTARISSSETRFYENGIEMSGSPIIDTATIFNGNVPVQFVNTNSGIAPVPLQVDWVAVRKYTLLSSNASFSSTPSDASIYIDNILQTGVTTPVTIIGIIPGSHTYKLTLLGYVDDTGTFDAPAGETINISRTLLTVANISATNMTVTPSETPCAAGTCILTVVVTWTNTGQTDGTLVPNIKINNVLQTPHSSRTVLANGGTATETFIISGLPAGPHTICPDPS